MLGRTQKVMLIGWDAADWKVINPLLDDGKMPNLQKIVEGGVIGNLATLYPGLSPMLWTSIATGKRPFKHGIHGFTEPSPEGGGIRPVTNLSRKTKAVWNILSQVGRKSTVVGWWPSHPAEPINGVMVSNQFTKAAGPKDKPWPVRPRSVYPLPIIKHLAPLRHHPGSISGGHIKNFVPDWDGVNQKKDKRLSSLARIISETLSIQDIALATLCNEPWQFAGVYFDGIDHFCHAFMNFHPPRLEWVPEDLFETYKGVVEAGYIMHDVILGNFLEVAGEDTTVILVSDHGFHSTELRPKNIPHEPAGPAAQHRHYGVFAMRGPGIKKDERIYGACLLDICPTILSLFGLPVGEDMDGKVLLDAFEKSPPKHSVPTWDREEGAAGMHAPTERLDPTESREAIAQLVALGYIDPPDENQEKAVSETVRELEYNLARSYMDAELHVEAVPILEKLWDSWDDEWRFGTHLIRCYLSLRRIEDSRRVMDEILARKKTAVKASREKLVEWQKEHEGKDPEEMSQKERRKLSRLRGKATWNPFAMAYLMGSLLLEEGQHEEALKHFLTAEKGDPKSPGLTLRLGAVHLKLKNYDDARRCFEKTLEADPDSAAAYLGLARSYLRLKRPKMAAEAAQTSIGLLYHNPAGFLNLGIALLRMGQTDGAVAAVNSAVTQNPNFPEAHRWLAFIYKKRLGDEESAERHLELAKEAVRMGKALREGAVQAVGDAIYSDDETPDMEDNVAQAVPPETLDDTIVVVTGLPRSGTSLMMQMLDKGGLEALSDYQRTPDEDNPKGYFEFEKAKSLRKDSSWLPEAKGRGVKIVAQLLPSLPPAHTYRFLFMERPMEQVLSSQTKMLERNEKQGANLESDRLAETFATQLDRVKKWIKNRQIPVLYVPFEDAVHQPQETASRINTFLGGVLDETSMASVSDPKLHRQRG